MSAHSWFGVLRRFLGRSAVALSTVGISFTVHGGGPLELFNHQPIVYANGGTSLTLNLDQGTLGTRSNAQAVALVQNAIALWNNVSTSTMRLAIGPQLATDYTKANYTKVLGKYTDGLNPVLFDTDGTITDALYGAGARNSILGFAGSAYWTSGPSAGYFAEGEAVLNGYLSVSDATWTIVLAHEIGHFFGLDHSQLDSAQGLAPSNYVLMYPIAYRSLISLHEDDIAAVTSLYPTSGVASVYGQLTGTFTTAGGTPILGANIWAQEISTGKVYSVVSDFLTQGSGYLRLYLPAGTYTLHAESIHSNFTGGSSVGPYANTSGDVSFQSPHPIAPVALGGGTPQQIVITEGCLATATFRLDGSGNVTGNCSVGTPGSTTTTVASSASSSTYGTTVTFTATVTGTAPTGAVGFSDDGATISGCAAVALTGSGNARTAACSTSALSVGSHLITASYAGDAGNSGSQGNLTQTVVSSKAATTTTLASSANPSAAGATITFTATVIGAAPTGSVGFTDGGVMIGGCGAVALTGSGNARTAACSTNALTAGSHAIVANYSGNDANSASASVALTQTVAAVLPGMGTIVANPYGALTIQGGSINGNTIANLQQNVIIQLGPTAGAAGSYAEIDFQGFNLGPGTVFTVRSGAPGQTLVLANTTSVASAISGTLLAQGGNGAAAPAIYLRNPSGVAIASGGTVYAPSQLTVSALGNASTTRQDIVNAGSIDGGASLVLLAANIKGGGAFKGNAVVISAFGSANNPVNGAHYLANGLRLFPSTGSDVYLTVNDYGNAPQYLNFMVNGNAQVWMPSVWPNSVSLPPNNLPVLPGGVRAAGVPDPSYGAGSIVVQSSGSMTLTGGTSNDFVFPGGIVLKAGGTLDLNGVIVDQGWTTTGQAFQGTFFESPNIVSAAGNIQVLSNNLNWVNFSTMPHAPVRTWTLVRAAEGSAGYVAADSVAPHLNTYSVLIEAAAAGQCWSCLVNSLPVNMY